MTRIGRERVDWTKVQRTVPDVHRDDARAVEMRVHRPIRADEIPQASDGSPFPIAALYERVRAASPVEVIGWVRAGEARLNHLQDGFDFHTHLKKLKPGEKGEAPITAFDTGQGEAAHLLIREKMLGTLEKMKGLDEAGTKALLHDLIDFRTPVVVGTDGEFVAALDSHHTMSSYIGLLGLAYETRPDRLPAAVRAPPSLYGLFEDVGVHATIEVEGQGADLKYDKLWKKFGDRFHLRMQDGTKRKTGLGRFGDLEDNPHRFLAAQTRVKTKIKGKGDKRRLRVEIAPNPLWIKTPGAPHQVEFAVAAVFADALARAGLDVHPAGPLEPDVQALLRHALSTAKADPKHPHADKLAGVMLMPEGVGLAEIQTQLRFDRERGIISFARD